MRNLKKLFAVIMAVAMLATVMVPALAEEAFEYEEEAKLLFDAGLFQGNSLDAFIPDLGTTLNRQAGLALAIRLMGKDAEVTAMTADEMATQLAKIVDADDITAWAKPYAAYAVKNGLTNGIDANILPNVKFGAQLPLSGKEFINFVLKIMGYQVAWDDVLTKAAEIGMLSAGDAVKFGTMAELNRDAAVGIMFSALSGKTSSGVTLAQRLVDQGAVTPEAMAATGTFAPTVAPTKAPEVVTVTSVTASNAREVTIVFSAPVDADTVKAAGNIKIGDKDATAKLADDKVTVTATVEDSVANGASNPVTYKIVVDKVKDANGVVIAKYETELKIFDVEVPVVNEIKLTGPKTFNITFSEPIETAGTVKVNNGVYGVTVGAIGKNVVTVTLAASTLPEADYSVEIAGFKDYAGFSIDKTTLTLAYVKDTTVPTATIKSAEQNKVEVEFDRAVTLTPDMKEYFYHTFSSWKPNTVTTTDNKVYTLNFVDFKIPEGNATLVIKAKANDKEIVDEWGNKVTENITLAITVAADKTAPVVEKVEAKAEDKIEVTFSKAVNTTDATKSANYKFKDADAKDVSTGFTVAYADKKATITFSSKLSGGMYTVEIAGIKDTSVNENEIVKATYDVSISDKTAIDFTKVTGSYVLETGKDSIIYVTYPEKMAVEGDGSVLAAKNYLLAGSALSDKAKLELFGSTGKVVKITIPETALTDATVLTIGRVADLAGNVPVAMSGNVTLASELAPAVTAVEQTDSNKLTVTINKALKSILPDAITGTVGASVYKAAAVDSWEIKDGKTIAKITLTSDYVNAVKALNANYGTDTSILASGIGLVGEHLVSEAGMKAANAANLAVTDKWAPKVKDAPADVKIDGTVADGQAVSVALTASEAMKVLTNPALANVDLVVTYDGTKLVAGTDYTVTVAGSTITVQTIKLVKVGKVLKIETAAAVNYLADNADNKLVSYSKEWTIKAN